MKRLRTGILKLRGNTKMASAKCKIDIQRSNSTELANANNEIERSNSTTSANTNNDIQRSNPTTSAKSNTDIQRTNSTPSTNANTDIQRSNSTPSANANTDIQRTNSSMSAKSNNDIQRSNSTKSANANTDIQQTNSTTSAESNNDIQQTNSTTSAESNNDIQRTNSTTSANSNNDIQQSNSTPSAKSNNDIQRSNSTKSANANTDIQRTNSTKSANASTDIQQSNLTKSANAKNDIQRSNSTPSTNATTDTQRTNLTKSANAKNDIQRSNSTPSTNANTDVQRSNSSTSANANTDIQRTNSTKSANANDDIQRTNSTKSANANTDIQRTNSTKLANTKDDIQRTNSTKSANANDDIQRTNSTKSANANTDIQRTNSTNSNNEKHQIRASLNNDSRQSVNPANSNYENVQVKPVSPNYENVQVKPANHNYENVKVKASSHYENVQFPPASSNSDTHRFKSKSNKLVVAAMDFGTTYSGYAYSLTHEYEKDPTKVFAHTRWHAGAAQLISLKTPSILLLNPDKSFKSFGYDAETDYAELAAEDEHKGYYFFRRFKMLLYHAAGLQRDMLVADDKGKKMRAIDVFKISIKFLHDHLLDNMHSRFPDIKSTDIRWVLTVPAIWNDSSKQFMREAAEMAGIDSDRLLIALEPEAASLYCMHLPVDRLAVEGEDSGQQLSVSPFQKGAKYMIVDVGGGTVDITVHEVIDKDQLKELDSASGGAWGGTQVDAAFTDFFNRLVGKDVMQKFSSDCKEDLVHLFREFETKKRNINVVKTGRETMKIPIVLPELYEEMKGRKLKDMVGKMGEFKDKVTISGDKIRVEADIMRSWFRDSTTKIVHHVKKLFTQPKCKDVGTILLVGGFSESPMLQDAMRRNFTDKRLIIPDDAGLVVLKGAVIFGHNPVTIVSRIAKCSYGIRVFRDFDDAIHPLSNKVQIGDTFKCRDVFAVHVRKGQALAIGVAQSRQRYTPLEPTQTSLMFDIYTSSVENPMFVTDDNCDHLGHLEVDVPNTNGGISRGVWVQMIFGGTEILVEARDEHTGKISKAKFDFLQDSSAQSSDAC